LVNKDNVKYSADFFVDSSGFKRVISSKLGAKWNDCKEYLPMDRAFAFPTAGEDNIPSWTLSRALSSGWQWRIPTQERYGNGYVYSSEFLSDDQALAEMQQYYKDPIQVGKSFKFSAGYVDKFWIKNCVSIGLAGSFVEPLEATSIGTSIQQAFALGSAILSWTKGNEKMANTYNQQFEIVAKNIIDFVQLHYITKRNDSPFWRSCKDLKLTDFNKETLEHFKTVIPSRAYFPNHWILFTEQNWLQVLHGLKLLDTEKIKEIWSAQNKDVIAETDKIFEGIKLYQRDALAFDHRSAIEFLAKEVKT
jgi:tryptophan halogenase